MSSDAKREDEPIDVEKYVRELVAEMRWGEVHAEELARNEIAEGRKRLIREHEQLCKQDLARRMSDYPVAVLPTSMGERVCVRFDGHVNAIAFEFLDRRGGGWRRGDRVELPLSRARDLAAALRDDVNPHSVALGRCALVVRPLPVEVQIVPSGELVTIPDPETKSLTLLFSADGKERRAVILGKGGRRKLTVAVDKARARGLDPSLFAAAFAKLGEQ